MPPDPWIPNETELVGNLHHLRGLLSQRVPRLPTVPVLIKVAEILRPNDAVLDGMLAVIQLSADRLHDNRGQVAELLYGLTGKSRGKSVNARRKLAAAKYREILKDAKYTEESFRTNAERALIADLASVISEMVEESYAPTSAAGANDPKPKLENDPAESVKSRRIARLINMPSLTLIGAALVVGVMVWVSAVSQPSDEPSIVELTQSAERHITGKEAPEPGALTNKLGYGDPVPGGRKTYHETKTGYIGSQTPTFNSLTDSTTTPEEERRFLGVDTSVTTDARQLSGVYSRRAVLARPGTIVWVFTAIVNNAEETDHCAIKGSRVAVDTRLQITIWNSPNGHLHIIRGWIYAKNTKPSWITDAVAVRTTNATTLEPDSSISREYSEVSPQSRADPLVNVESLLYPGLLIGGNGLVGSCWQDAYYFSLGFRQQ